jgi:hypothetical protein
MAGSPISLMLGGQLDASDLKETAVIFWKVKQALVIAAVMALALVGSCLELGGRIYGFYW